MSGQNLSRRAEARIAFGGVDITAEIHKYLISLTYTDNESDKADDLQIKLDDRGGQWLLKWLNPIVQAAAAHEPTAETVSSSSIATYSVTADIGLNVRSGPGIGYSKYGALSYGTKIQVTALANGWATTTYGGKTAYVCADYLKKDSEKTTSAEKTGESAEIKGMHIEAAIVRQNWNSDGKDSVLECGDFELDTVDYSGPPDSLTLKATSLPFRSAIRQTKRSKAWAGYHLSGIAREIAQKNGMAYLYDSATDPEINRAEQANQSDISFLSALCSRYGISIKASGRLLVLYDAAKQEAKNAVKTITKGKSGGYLQYKLRSGSADTEYNCCHVKYTNPATGSVIEYSYTPESETKKSSDEVKTLEITSKVHSIAEAKALAEKMLRLQNKYAYSADFTFPGDPLLCAGCTVLLKGWGLFDGKYSISQAKHSIGRSGYTTATKLRKIL